MTELKSELHWRTSVMRAINVSLVILAAVIGVWIYAEATRPGGANPVSVAVIISICVFTGIAGTPWYLCMWDDLRAARQAVSKAKEVNERHISP